MQLRNLDKEMTQRAQDEFLLRNKDMINEIMSLTQLRRNHACSPRSDRWGQPNPIDITGMLQTAFRAGMKDVRDQVTAQQEKE